ncbi:MAG: DASS family sodium-coupled anion symporter [Desulfurococcaceae archaeon]
MGTKLRASIAFVMLIVAHTIASLQPPEGLTSKSMAMLGITLLALVYWATECVPIPVTGLLIISLQVLYGIFPLGKAVSFIASKVNILVLAGLVISVALTTYSLDKLIGLSIASLMGNRADMLLLGLMLSTAVLSMWIPNTAAAALMAPVALGTLRLLKKEKGESNLGKVAMIGIAYAATAGGIGTPVGTPPVPITIENIEATTGTKIGFATWISWGIPISIVLVLLAWRILLLLYPPETKTMAVGKELIRITLGDYGKLTSSQKHALGLFGLAALLWLLDPIISTVFKDRSWAADWTYLASLIIIILYTVPVVGVLSWRQVTEKVDWGILFLVAGGLAIGEGLRETGIVDALSRVASRFLASVPEYVALVVIAIISGLGVSLFCSITATASTMVPLSLGIATSTGIDPRLAGIFAGIASCFAFLLPANSPPNAIVYSHGYFKNYEMVKAGALLIVAGILVLLLFAPLIEFVLTMIY